MSEAEPQYICRNFCVADPDTGVCLTCGRPPQPVVWPGLDEMLAQAGVKAGVKAGSPVSGDVVGAAATSLSDLANGD